MTQQIATRSESGPHESSDTMTDSAGYAKEPHKAYDPGANARRRAGWEKSFTHGDAVPAKAWNGVDKLHSGATSEPGTR